MLLFLENELKGLSYVALPCLFPVSYYFRPGSDEVELDILKVGGRRGGGLKSISPSRKTEKAFRLSSPRRPRLCLLNFPILSLFFLNFYFFFYHILDRTEWSLTRGYTFSLMCISNRQYWKNLDCLIKTASSVRLNLITGISMVYAVPLRSFVFQTLHSKWPKTSDLLSISVFLVLFLYTWKWITTSTFPRLRKEVCPRIPCEAKFELHHQLTGFGFFHSTSDCSKDNLSGISAHFNI